MSFVFLALTNPCQPLPHIFCLCTLCNDLVYGVFYTCCCMLGYFTISHIFCSPQVAVFVTNCGLCFTDFSHVWGGLFIDLLLFLPFMKFTLFLVLALSCGFSYFLLLCVDHLLCPVMVDLTPTHPASIKLLTFYEIFICDSKYNPVLIVNLCWSSEAQLLRSGFQTCNEIINGTVSLA